MKTKPCNCPGWTWAKMTKGARGGAYPACLTCGGAINRRAYEDHRYYHARLERNCECQHPVYPARQGYHQRWCDSRKGAS